VNEHHPKHDITSCPRKESNYAYDVNGNECASGPQAPITCANGGKKFTHNLANELTSVTSSGSTDSYTYDGAGNRLQDAGSTTTNYTWDTNAAVPLLATDVSSSATRRYTYADSLNSVKVGSTEYYYTHDTMGSVANLTNSSGAEQRTYTYEPYGSNRKTHNATGAPTNVMRFDSEYYDTSSATFDLRARNYDPGTGSFLENDPAGQSPSYAFAADRPIMMSDPSGMFSVWNAIEWSLPPWSSSRSYSPEWPWSVWPSAQPPRTA
jgi:RHS repeat-associated protein